MFRLLRYSRGAAAAHQSACAQQDQRCGGGLGDSSGQRDRGGIIDEQLIVDGRPICEQAGQSLLVQRTAVNVVAVRKIEAAADDGHRAVVRGLQIVPKRAAGDGHRAVFEGSQIAPREASR